MDRHIVCLYCQITVFDLTVCWGRRVAKYHCIFSAEGIKRYIVLTFNPQLPLTTPQPF